MTWRLELINDALMRIGQYPLASETAFGADKIIRIYTTVAGNLLTHPWTFIKKTRKLVRKSQCPVEHYAYAFEMPPDRHGAPRAFWVDASASRKTTDYQLSGNEVYSNAPEMWGEFMITGDGQAWPGDFKDLFTKALMAEFALSEREDRPLRNELLQECFGTPSEGAMGGLLGKCLTADNQAEPSDIVGGGEDPLLDVRW